MDAIPVHQTREFFSHVKSKTLVKIVRTVSHRTYTTHADERIDIPTVDPSRTVAANVYYPENLITPSPVLINFHGSGFLVQMHGSDDEFALEVVSRTPYTVIDASYRLAPEHPFPAATNDAAAVVNWVLSQPDRFDRSHISLSGFSAGGNLALGLAGCAFPMDTFRHVLTFYPVTDISKPSREKTAPDRSGTKIPSWVASLFDKSYARDLESRKNPLVSPSYCQPAHFPGHMLFITCSMDTLADEAEELAGRIAAVPGSHVVVERMKGCSHGWDKDCPIDSDLEEKKDRAYDLAIEMLGI